MKTKIAKLFTAICLSLTLTHANPLFEERNELSLDDLLQVKLETGSFLELDVNHSPISLTLIDKQQINNSGARHLSELLEIYVPGFQYMTNKWNGNIWGMRGVAGDKNDKIIVLVNGRKMNMQAFQGFAQEYTLGLLGDIERVEVLRGPAGLVYGSGAIGGVVNIVTKKAEDTETFASIKVENNLRNGFYAKQYEGAFYAAPEEGHHLAVHVGMRESKGFGENSARQFGVYEESLLLPNAPESDRDFRQATKDYGTPTAGSPHETPGNYLTSLDYQIENLRIYMRGTRQQDLMAPYFYPAPFSNSTGAIDDTTKAYIRGQEYIKGKDTYHHEGWLPHRRHHIRDNILLQGEYTFNIGQTDKLVLDAGYMGTTNRLINSPEFGLDELILYSVGERHYEIGTRYLLKSIEGLQIAIGGQYQIYDIGKDLDNRNITWNQKDPMMANITYTNTAFFTEGYFSLSDNVSLETGVRFDKHTRTNGVLSPKAAIVYQVHENHIFKLIAQSSSNNGDALTYELKDNVSDEPWRYELADAPADADPVTDLGNLIPEISQEELHNLKPERSQSYEIATSHYFDQLNINSSVSYNQLSELFLYNSVLQRPVNLGEYNAIVVELDFNYTQDDLGIFVGGNIAYQAPVGLDLSPTTFTRPGFEAQYINGEWVPVEIEDSTLITKSDLTYEQISSEAYNFNSLHSLTSKIYLDYEVLDYLTFHTNLRMFHGLEGRSAINLQHEENNQSEINFLGIEDNIMAKWNMAFLFNFDEELQIGFYGYDLLGEEDNLHAVRWHQMTAPRQAGLFTVDQRTYAVKVTQAF